MTGSNVLFVSEEERVERTGAYKSNGNFRLLSCQDGLSLSLEF